MGKLGAFAPETRNWLLNNFALGTKNYWFTFVADSSTALFFMGWEMLAHPRHPGLVLLALVGGGGLWTLTEYIFHRWIYHQEDGIYGQGHRIHHTDDQAKIAMPWFMTTITVFALWYVASELLRIPYFSGVMSGWLAGFVYYSLVHHSHHHWNIPSSWFRRLKAYHRIHHQFPEYNFGVTMRFWDLVFGTRYKKIVVGPRESEFISVLSYPDSATPDESLEEWQLVLKS